MPRNPKTAVLTSTQLRAAADIRPATPLTSPGSRTKLRKMINSHSFREQQLLTEFASLRTLSPPGVYLSLAPNNPWLWYGVIFLRKSQGVYTSIPIKFSISWPRGFPDAPPFVVVYGGPGHPLVSKTTGTGAATSKGASMTGSMRGMAAGYASLHPGAVNLRDGFPELFAPKGATASFSAGGSKSTSSSASPVELVYYLRSIFTDRYLEGLQERLEGREELEAGVIVDADAWRLWKDDREGLKTRVGAFREDEGVFGEWDKTGNTDVPIRFLDLQREALDTIKENLGRRVGGEDGV